MKKEFWLEVWDNNDIGFDQAEVNPLLEKHIKALNLSAGDSIFVPLCGKSIDMVWLLKQGYKIVGIELSEDAIKQFFSDLKVTPETWSDCGLKRYSAQNIEILVGDFFDLNSDLIGPVDAIYDRASLVALPADMRVKYAQHLMTICDQAKQLLITFNYDQRQQAGPPFSISAEEVNNHYTKHYQIAQLDSVEVAGGLKGKCDADEQVWLLN